MEFVIFFGIHLLHEMTLKFIKIIKLNLLNAIIILRLFVT